MGKMLEEEDAREEETVSLVLVKKTEREWKNHVEEVVNKKNDSDPVTEAGMVEGPI